MQRLVSCQASLSPSLVSTASPCDLKALCWCEKAVVVSCRPAWRPPASPIHPRAFPGGCLCVECSTPWSLEPNGVWERGLGFFSLCSAVQTCCHTAERDDSPESPLHLYFCLSACYTSVCLLYLLSVTFTICHITVFRSSLPFPFLPPFFFPSLLPSPPPFLLFISGSFIPYLPHFFLSSLFLSFPASSSLCISVFLSSFPFPSLLSSLPSLLSCPALSLPSPFLRSFLPPFCSFPSSQKLSSGFPLTVFL